LVDLEARADLRPMHSAIQEILAENPEAAPTLTGNWTALAMCERNEAAARQVLAAIGSDGLTEYGIMYPKAWYEGIVARMLGQAAEARTAFTAARAEVEKTVREQPDYAQPLSLLALIDAGLGRKEDAIREGRRAVELLPISKDALTGPILLENLALIYAWTGEKEQACIQLAIVTSVPHGLSYGALRLHPFFDPLRGDPCFEKIVSTLAPR
jgi:serine/threonine-protein kinase